MHNDPDLSAVIRRRPNNPHPKLPPTTLKRDFESLEKSHLPSNKMQTLSSDIKNLVKKRRISDCDYAVVEKLDISPREMLPDAYSMLLGDARRFEERINVTDSVLITTFTQAIFNYALAELVKEAKEVPQF